MLCALVQEGGSAFQCSMWNELVGGMKLNVDLAVSPPIYSLILLPNNTQCACERAYHGGTPGCLEWVCMDDIAKSRCCCIMKQCLELLEAQRAQKAPRGSGSYESF